MWDWIYTHVTTLVTTYPEILAMAGGILFPVAFSETLRRVWLTSYSNLDKTRAVSLVDFLLSLVFTDALWYGLDKGESHIVRIFTSLGIAMSCFILHMLALAVIHKRWPWLDEPDDTISH